MSDRPEPLVPADIDLSGYDYMPLYVTRLRKSRTWVRCKRRPALGFYLMNMWTEAFTSHERAGSLPDDDDLLADAAMCSPDEWEMIKAEIMATWILCSDGRWYHPVVAEVVLEVWEKTRKGKTQTRSATEAAAETRRAKREAKAAEANSKLSGVAIESSLGGRGAVTETVTDGGRSDNGIRLASWTDGERTPSQDETASDTDENGVRQASVTDANRKGNIKGKEPPPPTPAAKPERAASPEVVAVVDGFLAFREKHFPDDSRLPASRLTLETQAAQFTAKGAPAALILDVIERGMANAARDAVQYGKPPPNSLSAFNLSIDNAIAAHRKAQAGPSSGPVRLPPGGGLADDADRARWRNRLSRFCKDSATWNEAQWGPPPNRPGCQAPSDLVTEIIGRMETAA